MVAWEHRALARPPTAAYCLAHLQQKEMPETWSLNSYRGQTKDKTKNNKTKNYQLEPLPRFLLGHFCFCTNGSLLPFTAVAFCRRFNSYDTYSSLGLMRPLGYDQPETLTHGYYAPRDDPIATNEAPRRTE